MKIGVFLFLLISSLVPVSAQQATALLGNHSGSLIPVASGYTGAPISSAPTIAAYGYNATGVAWGQVVSGINATGSAGQTCLLTAFNNSSSATATVYLTGVNTIDPNTPIHVTASGSGATAAPTAASAGNGTATCSGTAVLLTGLGALVPLAVDASGNLVGGSYTLPIATTSVLGGVKPDGTSCTVNGTTGVLACPGSGSGTVNAGTTGQIAAYPTAGTAVSGVSSIGFASTATSTAATPMNAATSLQKLNSNFLRETHNQWALAGLQNSPLGSIVNLSQYGIGTSYTITAWSSSATTGLVTFTTSTAANSVGMGLPMLVSGLTTGTLFNNQIGIVVSNPQPTTTSITLQFPFRVTTSSAAESGSLVIQAVRLGISQLLDSTAQFHSGEQICQMAVSFPGSGGALAGSISPGGNGINSWGGWSCPSGGFGGVPTLSTACLTDGITACAPNGGTPLPFDFTHFPNGEGWVVYPSGSLTTASNTINKMGWLFETDPGSGTYTIATNNNGGGWVTAPVGGPIAPTGSATGAVGTGLAYMTAFSAAASYQFRITNSSGGNLYVWQAYGANTLRNGVVAMSYGRGGLSLGDYGIFPVGILQTWNEALQPHLMFYEAKNNGTNDASCAKASTASPSSYVPFQTLWNNIVNGYVGAPTLALMDIVAIGSYDVSQICVPFDNDVMRTSVAAMTATVNGTTENAQRDYFDGYYETTNNQMNSSLLNQTVTGNVHSGVNQQGALGDALAQYLGYNSWPNSIVPRPVLSPFTTTSSLNIPDTTAATTGQPYGLTLTPLGSNAVASIENDLVLKNLISGTGVACFGNNFVSCPANSTQFVNGGFTSFGLGAAYGHLGFAGTNLTLTYDTTGSFQGFSYIININNNSQRGGYVNQVAGVNIWQLGIDGNCGAGSSNSYILCDRVGAKPVLNLPSNTMPANSITGNAAGPVLLTVQTPAARKGTFICTSGGTITITNALGSTTSDIVITTKTAGGTQSWAPNVVAPPNGTQFQVVCATLDTSTYNYNILN